MMKKFLFSLLTTVSISAAGMTCSEVLSSQYETHLAIGSSVSRGKFDDAFHKWINKKANDQASLYFQHDSKRSRWDVLSREMSPHYRELMLYTRPQFFKDKVLPTPIELVQGMKKVYSLKGIPKDKWILPGVALENKKTGELVFKNYEDLKNLPNGFEVLEGHLPSRVFVKGLKSGVLTLNYTTEIVEKFDTFVYYHDTNHLASFTNKEYLEAIHKYVDYVEDRLKSSTRPEVLVDDLLGPQHGYDLFEEFQFIPAQNTTRLREFLAKFNGLSNIEMGPGSRKIDKWSLKNLIPQNIESQWKALEQRAGKNREEIEKMGFNLNVTPIEKLPENLRRERKAILKEFSGIHQYAQSIAVEMGDLYRASVLRLGAAAGDVFSYRARYYSLSYRTISAPFGVSYIFKEGYERYRIPRLSSFEDSVAQYIAEMIRYTQMDPSSYVNGVIKRAEQIY